ncbi:MAG: hypothetical protein M1831_005042 [Alyxoria varia]|nr:MAG: hypothetical protein M1831_005042 [Alyxoria varia]
MAHGCAAFWRHVQVYGIFGANTGVGKTIFSTLLCRNAAKDVKESVWYLKPVSTGPLDEADDRHVQNFAPNAHVQKIFQFDDAVSPHIAAFRRNITDESVLSKLAKQIQDNAQERPGTMLVETAGGVHSPGPGSTSQASLLRPLRLPILFVADWRLGGISTSISSYESLHMRGFDIAGAAIIKDDKYQNHDYLHRFFQERDIPLLKMPMPPEQSTSEDASTMLKYYATAESGTSTDQGDGSNIQAFRDTLKQKHVKRVERLETMASKAYQNIWYPFTQHKTLSEKSLNVIDSASGDYFRTYRHQNDPAGQNPPRNVPLLRSTFDGSASWWTQGLGHGNESLTAAAAYAAGRYGHVMFASGVHEPALSLSERLLEILGNPRLQRIFYSDNGSTAMEVAVKMALKATCRRHNLTENSGAMEIIGLQNSYHGDTIGAMDMSEPSVFNKQVPWYSGRGFWFDSPIVKMRYGKWMVEKPETLRKQLGDHTEHQSLSAVFDLSRDATDEAAQYEKYIKSTLERLTNDEKRTFGALVMEPVVLGAGGMILVDPLFQRTLSKVVRDSSELFSGGRAKLSSDMNELNWNGLPIVADEVFTGLYRLGHPSSSSLIHVQPDISVHAKLLTGGLVPLAATVASESVFEASLSPNKADALLHGHSYTAHPVGCAVANESLKEMTEFDQNGRWDAFKSDWTSSKPLVRELKSAFQDIANNVAPGNTATSSFDLSPTPPIWSVWSAQFVSDLSHASQVDSIWALGSVLSISLKDREGNSSYTSDAAKILQQNLLEDLHGEGWNVHSRVLGNVLYLMTSQTSEEKEVRKWETRVRQALEL